MNYIELHEQSPYRQNASQGMWKFGPKVSLQEIVEITETLAKDPRYTEISIRKVSKDQLGIGVVYTYDSTPTEEDFKNWSESMKDFLYKKFGTGLAGWDFGTPYWKIK